MVCGFRRGEGLPSHSRLNILLTNGRFPVSIDLARQLHRAGHTVYCVDPMQYHVCAFSIAVKQSRQVPSPHDNGKGYIKGVLHAVKRWNIDMILPVHEEIFCLAECGEKQILDRLLAPPFDLLVRLHNKWEFTKLMQRLGMGVPETQLCTSYGDVKRLPVDHYEHGIALKPCFGRATTGVHHLKPGKELPSAEEVGVGHQNHFVAQEWTKGDRYCSYSVIRNGRLEASGLYPVTETIDGSSSVYFEQKDHPGIHRYIETFVERCTQLCGPFNGQIAFDFVDNVVNKRLVAIECNPRSTSGLHLWTHTPYLAYALTNALPNVRPQDKPIQPPTTAIAHRPAHVQVSAGMLMWEHEDATLGVWAKHMARLIGTRDVVWRWRDMMPTVAQPFLLTEYYRMCRKAGLQLPELFQQQLLWEPQGSRLENIRRRCEEVDEKEDVKAKDMPWSLAT